MTESPRILDMIEDPTVTDPLSEVTRRERRALLGSCVVGFAISAGGLVPESIEAFGITVTPQQEQSLLYILTGVIGYFLATFAIYARADLKRRETVAARHRDRLKPLLSRLSEASQRLKASALGSPNNAAFDSDFLQLAQISDQMRFARSVQRTGAVRVFIDIYFPMIAATTTMVVVWSSLDGFPGWPSVAWGALAATCCVGVVSVWWRRRALQRWWGKRLRERHAVKQKELQSKIDALRPDDPRRADLTAQARLLLEQRLRDLQRGIF